MYNVGRRSAKESNARMRGDPVDDFTYSANLQLVISSKRASRAGTSASVRRVNWLSRAQGDNTCRRIVRCIWMRAV